MYYNNQLLMLLVEIPLYVVAITVIMRWMIRNTYVVTLVLFSLFIISTFLFYDYTFIIWTIYYTLVTFITALVVDFVIKNNRK